MHFKLLKYFSNYRYANPPQGPPPLREQPPTLECVECARHPALATATGGMPSGDHVRLLAAGALRDLGEAQRHLDQRLHDLGGG